MKNYILDIIHLNNDFTGTGMYMALYFVTLLFIAFYVKDKKYKNAILYPNAVLLFLVYIAFPFVNRFVIRLYDEEIRGRFSWVLMIPAIAAIGCTFLVTNLEDEKKQMLMTLFLVPVIFLCGVFQITDYRFQDAENLYKLPQSLLDASDVMLAEQAEKGDGIVRLIVPYETAHVFRQYSTKIELLYGEDATYGRIWLVEDERRDVCDTMQTTCPDLELIKKLKDEYNMEYILFDCVYTDFGLESINDYGYTEDENFEGDRTPVSSVVEAESSSITILKDDLGKSYWNLEKYGLNYKGIYGPYLLYSFDDK